MGDPYLGSGGGAKWISFLEDGQTGFSCLAYSGGAYGSLYRTGDGGKSFQEVQYPSARAVLSDGTYYNPFVMPERVYEEAGKLYMEAGQGRTGTITGRKATVTACMNRRIKERPGAMWGRYRRRENDFLRSFFLTRPCCRGNLY